MTIVCSTNLTDTHDFYTIVETTEKRFEIYHINMDSRNPVIDGPLNSWSFESVNESRLDSMHVRGSSDKEKINLNKKLMIFG